MTRSTYVTFSPRFKGRPKIRMDEDGHPYMDHHDGWRVTFIRTNHPDKRTVVMLFIDKTDEASSQRCLKKMEKMRETANVSDQFKGASEIKYDYIDEHSFKISYSLPLKVCGYDA